MVALAATLKWLALVNTYPIAIELAGPLSVVKSDCDPQTAQLSFSFQ